MTDAARRPSATLVRHGETAWSLTGQHTGRTDLPLSELGEQQGRLLAARVRGMRFDLVLSSPLRRARETCRLTGFGDVAEVTEDLAEWHYGADEGRTTAEIQRDVPGWSIWRDGVRDGESAADVAARVDRVIARVRAGGDALLFAHGHVLRVLAARWLDLAPSAGRHFALSTASISVLSYEHDWPAIVSWNETTFLRAR